MKICRVCDDSKELSEFYSKRNECKECCRERASLNNLSDPEARKAIYRKSHLKKFYGLTVEQYEELSKNGCGVCGTMDDLCVDHDHNCCAGRKSCGACVRGVLCGRHNKAEGLLNGDPNEAMALATYMIKIQEGAKI